LTVDHLTNTLEEGGYEYPRDLRRRKALGYVIVPVLFYAPILVGAAMNSGNGGIGSDLLLSLVLFLSIFVALLLLIVHSQRPWVGFDGLTVTVEGEGFQVRHLTSMALSTTGRAGLEPTHYTVSFTVEEPGMPATTLETHPIRSVKDTDQLVRDLRRLLPDVPFHDRTPLGMAMAGVDPVGGGGEGPAE
jgi:hypothetical protein